MRLQRRVSPEALDTMPANDPRARRSRRDLQRVHRAMRSLTILRHAAGKLSMARQPRTILELGAGDGSLMLRFAQSGGTWRDLSVTFLDRHDLVNPQTRRLLGLLGWHVQVLAQDALDWARATSERRYDLGITTLFLHHFQTPELELLLRTIAARCSAFVALEPRRNAVARIGSHLLGFLGTNKVTRADGVTSVLAGFAGHELSDLWPAEPTSWRLCEYFAWPFTHCFVADRADGADGRDGIEGQLSAPP
jgi:hypothetical protein